MADFYEIDFLDVESQKSGDAITIRYEINGDEFIHVVDGGFQATGEKIVAHIKKYYGQNAYIDHVVVTHPDGDHAGGLRTVLEELNVGQLWMLMPWDYADELIDKFQRFSSVEGLKTRLREIYPNLHALEEIANRKNIPIHEPFQGTSIGSFTVMAPTRARYLDLIVNSEKTPETITESEKSAMDTLTSLFEGAKKAVVNIIKAAWGEEVFSSNETSSENEMSVIQFATLSNKKILLTGDAGRSALTEAADFAPAIGLTLPGIDNFQVPHHGSRRNVSTEILDRWLGPRHEGLSDSSSFIAAISSAKADEAHPRNAVVRAMYHRGGRVYVTEGNSLCVYGGAHVSRGWAASIPLTYPDGQEE